MGARSTGSHPTTTKADGHLLEYFRQNFTEGGGGSPPPPPATGIVASGGVINDYTSGSDVYRSHIFNSSGVFQVTGLSNRITDGDNVEYIVVAGGGGSGFGGGGAGGVKSNSPEMPSPRRDSTLTVSTSPGSYTVTIGAGGYSGSETRLDKPDQIQYLVPLPQMAADGVEEDLLEVQQILDLVELVDQVVAADTTQGEAVLLILVVLLQIAIKEILEELDINLEVTMVAVAVAVPVVLEVMLQVTEVVDMVVQD